MIKTTDVFWVVFLIFFLTCFRSLIEESWDMTHPWLPDLGEKKKGKKKEKTTL